MSLDQKDTEPVETSSERPTESAPLEADKNNISPPDLRDPKLRSRVASLLSKVSSLLSTAVVDTAEIERYMSELVDTQYKGSMTTLKLGKSQLYNPERPKEGDVQAPTLEQVKEILASKVTPQQLEVIKKMEKPTLQLIPITSMTRYGEFMMGYVVESETIVGWQKKDFVMAPFVGADERDGVTNNKSIIRWQIAITEGAKEPKLLDGDDEKKTLRKRGRWFAREYAKKGVKGVDLKKMLVLMMDSLKRGEPVSDFWDEGTSSLINEAPENDGYTYWVEWCNYYGHIVIHGLGADKCGCKCRFRTSVVIDVPNPRSL